MKIELIKRYLNNNITFKHMPLTYCCEDLERSDIIELHESDNKSIINFCVKEAYYQYYDKDYDIEYNYHPIYFCPFCGEKIEIEVIKEEDMTALFNKLSHLVDELYDNLIATDSFKLASEIKEKLRLEENKLNNLFKVTEYKEEEKMGNNDITNKKFPKDFFNKQRHVISCDDADNDYIPFEFSEEVLNGDREVTVSLPGETKNGK